MIVEARKIRNWVDSEKLTDNFLLALRLAGVPMDGIKEA
jgi:hypothetical protein